ncbi:unnamed protein product, partial [Mesorhabditis spiculigera]
MMTHFGKRCERDEPMRFTLLDRIDLDCDGLFEGDQHALAFYKDWAYDHHYHTGILLDADDRCAAFKTQFHFQERPLSREEADFPLAYGLVVYKNIMQVLHMLSAFYQPQNLYCIAMDGHSNETFKALMRNVGGCFSNIHIIEIPRIGWGEYGIVTAVWSCLKYAAASQNQWKYYQYLSGVDVPLKTNLEMVRIFKALNGSMNMEFIEFQPGRLNGRKVRGGHTFF